jgi:type IV secretion system protein VirB8
MTPDPALEAYLKEAASWDADRVLMANRSTRTAWRVAIGACALTGLSLTALVLLMPLKRVDPFVIRVDNTSGVVDVVPTFVGRAEMPDVLTRYLLTHYVTVCERFNFATAESDYEECAAFHSAARNQTWVAHWDRSNPSSPLNVHKDGSSVRAQVSSLSFFKRASGVEDLAQVRYTKSRRTSASANDQVTHWIATVQYVYSDPPTDPRVRRWNPLGFKIIEFRSEAETVPAESPSNAGAQPTIAAAAEGSP